MTDGVEGPDYRPIVEDIRRQISEGKLKPGQKLPSISKLEAAYKQTNGVVRGALTALRIEGLVSSHHGKGYFVRSNVPAATPSAEFEAFTQALDDVQAEVRRLAARVEQLERDREPQSAPPVPRPGRSARRADSK